MIETVLPFFISAALKFLVGIWGYSGQSTPPMYGDKEAQRHWMEITSNIAIGDWYRNTTSNDLLYWGLDYPPLTAYHSYLFGLCANTINPSMVALKSSRGYESSEEKIFMRSTVQISDIIIFVPAILFLVENLKTSASQRVDNQNLKGRVQRFLVSLFCLLQPGLLIIDHGHFQYNGVCIGFALLAAYAMSEGKDVVASVLFCLSLNFKQMSLYYALIFFSALLRKCFDSSDRMLFQIWQVTKLGFAVIVTFACLWAPFCVLHSTDETCLSSLLHVLHRQFPFSRGIFEDKVSNIWYSISVLFDLRQVMSTQQLVLCSFLLTLALTLPVCCNLLLNRFDLKRFLIAMMNGSLAFFLASYQVHEKSVLLPLVPASLLVVDDPDLVLWLQLLGTFSMFPLLVKDKLRIPYWACGQICVAIYFGIKSCMALESKPISENAAKRSNVEAEYKKWRQFFFMASYSGMVALHVLEIFLKPPPRYPDLYPALFSIFSAANLCIAYVMGLYWQWTLPTGADQHSKEHGD